MTLTQYFGYSRYCNFHVTDPFTNSSEFCEPCDDATVRFRATGWCVRCAVVVAGEVYKCARGRGIIDATLHPNRLAAVLDGLTRLGCSYPWATPLKRPEQPAAGRITRAPCAQCGTPGLRQEGNCEECGAKRRGFTPRQWELLGG